MYIIEAGAQPTPRIIVSKLDGSANVTIVESMLDQPRDIVLDPGLGVMVWSDWGPKARIEIAGLDGTSRRILVKDDIQWPTGIAIDHPTQRLYWADPKERAVESVSLLLSKDLTNDRHVVRYFLDGRLRC